MSTTCAACCFAKKLSDTQYECRRFPPPAGYGFPVRANNDWCGEGYSSGGSYGRIVRNETYGKRLERSEKEKTEQKTNGHRENQKNQLPHENPSGN